MTTTTPTDRPTVKLTGTDGNAFAVMGVCTRAAKRAGWSADDVTDLTRDMMSGDYDHLLGVAMTRFDVV